MLAERTDVNLESGENRDFTLTSLHKKGGVCLQ